MTKITNNQRGTLWDKETAVSPVVGVMLMLVVTIIIAALVSTFAGGVSSNNAKPISATISAEYSQTNGLMISHTGGDVIPCDNTQIYVETTSTFGPTARVWKPNTSVIILQKNGISMPWYNITATNALGLTARQFKPGETAFVNTSDLGQVQPRTYSSGISINGLPSDALMNSTTGSYANNANYGFLYPGNVGNSFVLKMVTDGRTIAQTEVMIKP